MARPPEETELMIKQGGAGRIVPWLLAAASMGFAAYLYGMVYRPLQAEDRKKAIDLREQRALARDARREADDLKTELAKRADELKEVRADLAESGTLKEENEKLVKQLKEKAEAGVEVSGQGGRITVTMVDRILFNSGEADLTNKGETVLRKLGSVFKGLEGKRIQVSGHTDTAPIKSSIKQMYPTNWELSVARAVNVVRFLQTEVGVNPRHMMAAGYGQYRPVASNVHSAGMAKNRRIEILLLPEDIKVVKGEFPEVAAAEAAAADPKSASKKGKETKPTPAAADEKSASKKGKETKPAAAHTAIVKKKK